VGFVAFEKQGVLSAGGDFENFAAVAGGDVEVAGAVEEDVPDVLGFGLEVRLGGERQLGAGLGGGVGSDAVDLAVGRGGGVDDVAIVPGAPAVRRWWCSGRRG
jgi:hypothetical protein